MIVLTQEEKDILEHEMIDPEYWVNGEDATIGKKLVPQAHLEEKLARLKPQYDAAVLAGSYKTRKQRDDLEAQAEQDRYDNAPYPVKRQRSYPPIGDQLDDIYHNGIDAWKATIKVTKEQYPNLQQIAPEALDVWKDEMVASDATLPRWAEDLYDALPLEIRDTISAVTKNKIVQKKAKRELRPS
tara:strand:+ start:2194 stop:2748 length:555 start_codon:yes stop_codon:yes gene_type:complete